MVDVDISRLVPVFLLCDTNGRALAKAIEKGTRIFCRILDDGIHTALHVEQMPEWRLDEMAWELGCLYDFHAGIESKRAWIRDAVPLYASYGTVEAIYKYLGGRFQDVDVEESWQYGGEPYHFRVTLGGEWTEEKVQWARRAVETIKNVRSVMDEMSPGGGCTVTVSGETMWRRFPYAMAGGLVRAGTLPEIAFTDQTGENTDPSQESAVATAQPEGTGTVFSYPQTGENLLCGEENL